VDTVLGLLEMLAWILVVIALAMVVTWTVVKLTPGEKRAKAGQQGSEG